MGAFASSLIFQPLTLGIAVALMVSALIYQNKYPKDCEEVGGDIFKLNMGLAVSVVIVATITSVLTSLMI